MKKPFVAYRCYQVLALLGWLVAGPVFASGAFDLAREGGIPARVVTLPGAGPVAEEAVRDFRRVVGVMCGAVPEVADSVEEGPCVVIGLASEWAKRTGDDDGVRRLNAAAPESFMLKSDSRRLLILGKDPSGVSHGVYTVLRDLGCRWYFIAPEWEVIPRRATVSIDVDRVEGPALRLRKLNSGMGQGGASRQLFETWQRRNRLGSAYGRNGINHAYANYVPGSLFKEHPEYFAWVSADGQGPGDKQNGLQPCTTHPEVIRRFTEGALTILRQRRERNPADARLLSVSPNDNTGNLCRCDKCRAAGSYTDCALLLANRVAEAIAEEFPETLVGFMAYGRVAPPPRAGLKAHPNVIVSMATAYTWNTFSLEMLDEWPKHVGHLIMRDYYCIGSWGGDRPDYTGPMIADLAQGIAGWQRQGIEGIEAEMNHSWATCGHRFWAAAELMWNPSRAAGDIKQDFYQTCWGPAAVPMRRYYERWESGIEASDRALGLAFLDLAEAARTAGTPAVLKRVNLIGLYLHRFHLLKETERVAEECARLNLGEEETQNRLEAFCEEGNQLTYRWKDAYLLPIQPKAYQMTRPSVRYEASEVAAILDRDVAHYRKTVAPLVELGGAEYSADLVPLPDRGALAAHESVELQVGTASYLLRAGAGQAVDVFVETVARREGGSSSAKASAVPDPLPEPVAGAVMNPEPAGPGPGRLGRLELWFLGHDGTARELAGFQRVDASAQTVPLRFTFAREGLYLLNARLARGKPLRTRIVGPPYSLVADARNRRDYAVWSPLPGSARGGAKPATLLYFFVPSGTKHFAIRVSRLKSARPMAWRVATLAGRVIREEPATQDSEWVIEVPPDAAGDIWTLRLGTDTFIRLGLEGIPPYVATHPGGLLVPREQAQAWIGRK